MDNLLHPITWGILFTVGIVYTYMQFKEKKIDKILMIHIIALMIYSIDCNTVHFLSKNRYVSYVGLPLFVTSFCANLFSEDYIIYRKNPNNENKKILIKSLVEYIIIISFFIFVFAINPMLKLVK